MCEAPAPASATARQSVESNGNNGKPAPLRGKRRSSSIFRAASSVRRSIHQLSTAYVGRLAKPANAYLRWNLLLTFLLLLFLTSCAWLPLIPGVRRASLEVVVALIVAVHLLWLIAILNAIRYAVRLLRFRNHVIDLTANKPDGVIVKHLVGISLYKEPLELMISTVDSIACQFGARQKISVVVGMEDGTPDREEKQRKLTELYMSKFERFIVTIHPRGLPGDIPGKCSNLNFSMRTAVQRLRDDTEYPLDNEKFGKRCELIVTTGDCDSVFGERYFDALEEDFWKVAPEKRRTTVWQSPLFYAINLHKSPFFVRVTGLLRSFFMMGFLIPWNINTMSIFSLSLHLYEAGEYTHPGYQMEDIIALIRWSLAVRRYCTIRAIPVATLSGPTSGKNYYDEWYEWARQIRRWMIGAAEVFHYFAVKSRALPASVVVSFSAKFAFYYCFLFCTAGLFGLVAPFVTPAVLSAIGESSTSSLLIPSHEVFTYITLGFIVLTYIELVIVFIVNSVCGRVFPNAARDETGIFRSLLHLVLAWPTLLMHAMVALFAFLEVTVRGKAVCSHSASKKNNLVAPAAEKAPSHFQV